MKALLCSLALILTQETLAYSIISHQAVVDASWKTSILPLLQKRFPTANDSVLKEAHAYAYGGSVAADMGYFPFGSATYSNLVHYVRSGDFVQALIEESADVKEYAFALGFLCHYNADKYGHSIATNKAAPLLYPKVRQKHGSVVTYEEDPTAHARTEFGFDVLQVARGTYESQAYRDFIGFQISKPVLDKAFYKTYALRIDDVFGSYDRAVGTFRWTVRSLLPTITKAAWKTKRKEIAALKPGLTSRQFNYRMNRRTYYQSFGREREKAGFGASIVAFVVRILPKIGPLKKLRFVVPNQSVEKLFIQSFDTTTYNVGQAIQQLNNKQLMLANIDYDTGQPTHRGEYQLADESYSDLLLQLSEQKFEGVDPSLKAHLLQFFNQTVKGEVDADPAEAAKKNAALIALQGFQPVIFNQR